MPGSLAAMQEQLRAEQPRQQQQHKGTRAGSPVLKSARVSDAPPSVVRDRGVGDSVRDWDEGRDVGSRANEMRDFLGRQIQERKEREA